MLKISFLKLDILLEKRILEELTERFSRIKDSLEKDPRRTETQELSSDNNMRRLKSKES